MQVNNVNNTSYNPQFRAIFKLRNDGSGIADIITKAVSDCTVKSEANKISQKFQLGGGSLYVYVPDENMEKLLKCKRTTSSGIFDNQFRNFGTVR